MATRHVNSSFKIKVGSAQTTLGIIPEPGAMLFHKPFAQMFYADGFNWIPMQQEIDSLALQYIAAQLYELTADTPAPLSLFDTLIYNTGDSYTVDVPGETITIDNDGDYQFNVNYEISADSNRVTVNTAIVINGTPEPGYNQFLQARDEFYTQTLSFPKTLTAADVLTFQITADGNDDVTMRNVSLGIQKIV